MVIYRFLLGTLLLLGLLQIVGPARAVADPLYDKPVYDPGTKSYFELVLVNTTKYSYRNSPDVNWPQAYELAKDRVYKGVHGRLAIIKSLATHEFLESTFKPTNISWIGLRYWCSTRTLQFTDGTFWERGMFQVWDGKWDHSAMQDPCEEYHSYKKPQFMPVAYMTAGDGFRWFATGWHKAYYCYFVEYPTGQP